MIDTSNAETWLDEDTFISEGQVYYITPDCKIIKIETKNT